MSFESILQAIMDESAGALGIALMGSDGIPIVQRTPQLPAGAVNPLGDDVGTAAVEFARILSEIQKAADALHAGAMAETVITLARFQLLFRQIDDDVFLVLALAPTGNAGKARYLIRRNLFALKSEL